MDVVEEIIEDPNSIWFEEGTYQAETNREVDSINIYIYNEEKNRVAIFKKVTREFITFCQPDEEVKDLMETGNFGGRDGWFSGQAKNLPPQQSVSNEMTPVNSFESGVMGITPAPKFSSVDEIPNKGFTPLNSFENDVLGVTPVDYSASD